MHLGCAEPWGRTPGLVSRSHRLRLTERPRWGNATGVPDSEPVINDGYFPYVELLYRLFSYLYPIP